jgi:hypothetical protein
MFTTFRVSTPSRGHGLIDDNVYWSCLSSDSSIARDLKRLTHDSIAEIARLRTASVRAADSASSCASLPTSETPKSLVDTEPNNGSSMYHV